MAMDGHEEALLSIHVGSGLGKDMDSASGLFSHAPPNPTSLPRHTVPLPGALTLPPRRPTLLYTTTISFHRHRACLPRLLLGRFISGLGDDIFYIRRGHNCRRATTQKAAGIMVATPPLTQQTHV